MHLTAPPAFHPPSSLLGQAVQRWAKDRRQAESIYIVAVALVLVAVMLAGQWGWVLWGLEADGSPNVAYFAVQLVVGLIVGGGCLFGWHRPVHVIVTDDGLTIRRRSESLALSWDEVMAVEPISAEMHHRHWRRYRETRMFINRTRDRLLLLRTTRGPVVVGLPASELERFDAHLAEHFAAPVSRLVRAA